eukprot:scaffold18601_cov25-Cyclotella_meneghiniana.AAC.2
MARFQIIYCTPRRLLQRLRRCYSVANRIHTLGTLARPKQKHWLPINPPLAFAVLVVSNHVNDP